jgi:hypothetical protein
MTDDGEQMNETLSEFISVYGRLSRSINSAVG